MITKGMKERIQKEVVAHFKGNRQEEVKKPA
jgi:hypothetical protein